MIVGNTSAPMMSLAAIRTVPPESSASPEAARARGAAVAPRGAVAELLCEVFLSPVGYKVVRGWERENVGAEYLERHATA